MRLWLDMPRVNKGPKKRAADEGIRPERRPKPVPSARWSEKFHGGVRDVAIGIYPLDFTQCEIAKICEREFGQQPESYRKRPREIAGWAKETASWGGLVMFKEKRICKSTGKLANVYRWRWTDLSKDDKQSKDGKKKGRKHGKRRARVRSSS